VRQLVAFQSRPVSPSPVYPAGRVAIPADPNTPPGGGGEFGKVGGVCPGCKVVAQAIHTNAVKGSR
jgi:hypothetical protein